jgi:putative integral membrane protein (TIGR02587 family)
VALHKKERLTEQKETQSPQQGEDHGFGAGLGRAFAGALIFAISLFMTMEMWWLGFYLNHFRFALFLTVNAILLIGLARVRGFKQQVSWGGSIIDAFVGYAVGFITGAGFLYLFGAINFSMPWSEIVGKIALQSIPGSIGALLARSQLGGAGGQEQQKEAQKQHFSYTRELFLMVAGALFVGFTVAPTEEIVLIAYQINPWIAIGLVLVSLVIVHTVVYLVNFYGQEQVPEHMGFWGVFLHFSVVGYALVFLTSLYVLWTFGRLGGTSLYPIVVMTIVLSVPGALGAAAARLIL